MTKANESEIKKKDLWDKFQIMAEAAGAIGIPLIVVLVGLIINSSLKNQESGTKLIEVAIEILKSQPKNNQDKSIRSWAIDVVDRYSDIKIGSRMREALQGEPIYTSNTELYQTLVGSCSNMEVYVFFSYSELSVVENISENFKMEEEDEKCFVLPTTDEADIASRMRAHILSASNTTDTSSMNISGNYLHKPCKDHNFYIYVPSYTDVHGKNAMNEKSTCVIDFYPS